MMKYELIINRYTVPDENKRVDPVVVIAVGMQEGIVVGATLGLRVGPVIGVCDGTYDGSVLDTFIKDGSSLGTDDAPYVGALEGP